MNKYLSYLGSFLPNKKVKKLTKEELEKFNYRRAKLLEEKFEHITLPNNPEDIKKVNEDLRNKDDYYMLPTQLLSDTEKSLIVHLGKITKATKDNEIHHDNYYVPARIEYTFENTSLLSINYKNIYKKKMDENGVALLTKEEDQEFIEQKSGGRRRKTYKRKLKKIVSHKKSSKKHRVYS